MIEGKEYLNSFPTHLPVRPGIKYEVHESRKVFGNQRYSIISVNKFAPGITIDWHTREEAELMASTATLLSKVWTVFESDPGTIRSLVTYLSGEEVDPGLSDRSVLGRLINDYSPNLIASMFEDFPPGFFN